MRKTLILLAALALFSALPATAARQLVLPLEHPTIEIYQCYPANSEGTNVGYAGYDGFRGDVISSAAGILSIAPGPSWANYVGAARDGVRYAIKNVVLAKIPGQPVQCSDRFPTQIVYQHGTPNVRLWWPLMYETPGTVWRLLILYGTYSPYDDDGDDGPNPPSYVHTEIWQWELVASLDSMQCLLDLFHQLPYGTNQVPLVSDEELYLKLRWKLGKIEDALALDNKTLAGLILGRFDEAVDDACILDPPPTGPAPSGAGTGITNTEENPACCKLMVDAEYVGKALGIWQQSK